MKPTQVYSDGNGNYTCGDCGHKWMARERYQWWPIRLGWRRKSATKFFAWHGWQTGWDGIEQRVYGQTFHIGALKVCFGSAAEAHARAGSGENK